MQFTNCSVIAYNTDELMPIIKSCADIGDYNHSEYDENELMRRFLYTYRNFEIITDKEPQAVVSDNFTMCRSDFVKDAYYKVFRKNPPSPPPEDLTVLGFCENNGFYTFIGGYTEYFATDVAEIIKIIPFDDNDIYVIFTDYYRKGSVKPQKEYSSMIFGIDDHGYYVKSIKMNDDFMALRKPEILQNIQKSQSDYRKYLPLIVIAISFLAICIIIYIFFIRV